MVGDLSVLPDVKYCITLDSDTRLPRGVARELIGIITHPLNRPTFDPAVGRVTEGYGILQPRISVTFMSAAGSLFARLYSGHTGVDPYTSAVSDTYQDLFGEGIFTGKGLYDVDAFIASLEDTVPENALLSHDLFEGLHARVALVTDVELVDDYPRASCPMPVASIAGFAATGRFCSGCFRSCRRGADSSATRLRRSGGGRSSTTCAAVSSRRRCSPCSSPAGCCCPARVLVWTLAAVAVVASQLLPIVASLLTGPRSFAVVPGILREPASRCRHDAGTGWLSLTFLAFHAYDSAHAIVLTLVRLAVTRRRLLEWETAAATAARAAGLVGARAACVTSRPRWSPARSPRRGAGGDDRAGAPMRFPRHRRSSCCGRWLRQSPTG